MEINTNTTHFQHFIDVFVHQYKWQLLFLRVTSRKLKHDGCVKWNNGSNNVHDKMHRTHEYVRLDGKGGLKLLIYWCENRTLILDYLGGPNAITTVFKSKSGGKGESGSERCNGRKAQLAIAGFEDGSDPAAKEWVASRSWKIQGNGFSLIPPKRNIILHISWF